MRHTGTNNQVAHTWAQQGENTYMRGHHMYFEGNAIFSYGDHFCIAKFVKNKQGGKCVLFTKAQYSNTTAGHKSIAYSAIDRHKYPTFEVGSGVSSRFRRHATNTIRDFGLDSTNQKECDNKNLKLWHREFIYDAQDELARYKKSKTTSSTYILEYVDEKIKEANQFKAFFDLKNAKDWTPAMLGIDGGFIAQARLKDQEITRIRQERWDRRDEIERERRLCQQIHDKETFEKWLQGEGYSCPWSYQTDAEGSAYLRRVIRDNKDLIQTSRNADVPFRHGVRVFKFVKLCRATGRTFEANGSQIRVGYFHIDKIDADGNVKAGCHYLTWQRIEEFAKAQGFFEEMASPEALESKEESNV